MRIEKAGGEYNIKRFFNKSTINTFQIKDIVAIAEEITNKQENKWQQFTKIELKG